MKTKRDYHRILDDLLFTIFGITLVLLLLAITVFALTVLIRWLLGIPTGL